jgi:hypothetical protein
MLILVKLHFCRIISKIHRYKFCSVVATCVSGCSVCIECRAECGLVFYVCEGSLGFSILVSVIRNHENDYFQSYSVLQC